MPLAKQIAIVTGASRGIGRAIALKLAEQSATVIAVARSEQKLADLAEQARKAELPGTIVPRTLDLTQRGLIDAFVEQAADEFTRLDILVNNAGITRDGLLLNMEDEDFETVLTTNLRSVFWITRSVSRYMVRGRYGRIINIGSVSGIMGNPGQSNYAAAKAALMGFSKTVAKELARRNVTCNVVAPGFITTDMTAVLPDKYKEGLKPLIPCQKFGEPDDIAAAVAFLASPAAGYITGQTLAVDGGLSM